MADTALKLVLLGQDKSASKALKGVGNEAGKTHGKLGKLGGVAKGAGLAIAAGLVIAAGAAIKFGGDSLAAFADADKSQKKLEDAYRRFPKVQNVSIDAMRKYNQELQRKTGADADDIAAGQATLAMFKLTGKQIKNTTPLLVDYAAKTGKSLPDSAKTMGKALLGNTKALKDMGISYKSTGDAGKDYANITALLQEKVGGYADSIPEAEKKQKILAASFGDLQESIGEKLQPAMLGLVDAGQGVLDWMDKNPAVMEGVAAAGGLVADMFQGLWFVISKWVAPAFAWFLKLQVASINGFADLTEAANNSPLGALIPDDAADKIRDVGKGLWEVANGLESLGKEPKIDTGAEIAKQEVKALDKQIKGLKGKQVKAEAKGDTKEVAKIQEKINKLKGKKVSIGVGLTKSGKQTAFLTHSQGLRGVKVSFSASGNSSFPGGLTMVGDGMGHSPELVDLPQGSRILSTGQTRARQNQARSGGGAGGDVYITVKGDTNPNAAARRIARAQSQLRTSYGPGFRPVKGRG